MGDRDRGGLIWTRSEATCALGQVTVTAPLSIFEGVSTQPRPTANTGAKIDREGTSPAYRTTK